MLNRFKFKNHEGEDDDLAGLPPLDRIARQLPRLRSEVRLARRSYRLTITVVVLAILTGAVLFYRQGEADQERAAAARQYDLDQCARSNASRQVIAEAFDTQRDVLIAATASADGTTSPRRQASLDAYNSGIDELVAKFSPRDCVKLLDEAEK